MKKIRKKQRSVLLILVVSCIVLISDIVLIGINYYASQQALNHSLMQRAQGHMEGVELALGMTKRNMLQLATHFSGNKKLNLLFLEGKKAVAAEGSASPKAAEIRKKILSDVKSSWDEMTSKFDVRQLHYHLGPGSLSFLRVHKPHKFGDRMDDVRYTIVDTNAELKARTGFETGRVYSGIRGVVPIFVTDPETEKKVHVGALEVGTSYTKLLMLVSKAQGTGSAILLTKAHAERNMWPNSIKERFGDILQTCGCFIESSSRPLAETKEMISMAKNLALGSSIRKMEIIEKDGRFFTLYQEPLRDYRGESNVDLPVAGSTIIWDDVTLEVNKFNQDFQLNILYGILGFFIIEIVLFFAMRVERKIYEMGTLAGLDGLTGIPNRRDFDEVWLKEISRARRYNQPLSVVMCDVDYFKLFNDSYGHVRGDECLRKVASALSGSLHRSTDYVARYGGEEFVYILPNTTVEQAEKITEKARLAIIALAMEHKESSVSSVVTMSFGIASMVVIEPEEVKLIRIADECLYKAKAKGRNCAVSKQI